MKTTLYLPPSLSLDDRPLDFSRELLDRCLSFSCLDLDFERVRLDLDRLDLDLDLLLDRDFDLLLRSLDRDLLEREDERLLDLCLERERRDRDLDLLERRRRPLDRDRVRLELRLSFESIPITGSIAADIKLWASLTRDIASSISFWAASLLLACGLTMACVACIILMGLPLISLPCNLKASMMLGCSENSINTWLVLSDWRVQFIRYFTSPAGVKKLMRSSAVIDESGFTTSMDLRISSTLQLSKLPSVEEKKL